ncbi:MAG: ATP-binding protein [Candidatus Dependentiae bacterium]|nr:ATP-binding protein [Candidatus Dependentiae bacterium]
MLFVRKKSLLFIVLLCYAGANTCDEKPQENSAIDSILQQEEPKKYWQHIPPEWLAQQCIDNAPHLLKGILYYLKFCDKNTPVPSYHRLILVGPPGTGKTTLANVIAYFLRAEGYYVPATSFLGHFRNQTAENINKFLKSDIFIKDTAKRKVIIIDELHKLFEHYQSDMSDASETAAAFWLILDYLEKNYPNIIIIAAMNDASNLPPEIKSRFHGKIITMPLPDKKQKIETFKNITSHDKTVQLAHDVDDHYIADLISQCENFSLRDVQLLIDTAKMFRYADCVDKEIKPSLMRDIITLHKVDFQQAVNKLQGETKEHEESFFEKHYSTMKKMGAATSLALNVYTLSRIFGGGILSSIHLLSKNNNT